MLEVHLLGPFRLVAAKRGFPSFPTRAAKLLFSYLILHRERSHSRAILSSLLAGDSTEGVARKKLRQELWRIRTTLDQGGGGYSDVITADSEWVGVDPTASLWIDAEQFELAIRRADACDADDECVEALFEAAYDLYAGALLEGEYAGWCLVEQDRYRAMHQEAAERLIHLHARRGAWQPALRRARDVLRDDPLAENVHRQIIALLYLTGDRPGALRQFSECRRILRQELSIEPMARTHDLIRAVSTSDRGSVLGVLGLRRDPCQTHPPSARAPAPPDHRTPAIPGIRMTPQASSGN